MKNKLILLLTCFFFMFVTFMASNSLLVDGDYNDQHIADKGKTTCDKKDKTFCSHLPLVMIDTNNKEIPGVKRDGTFVTSTISIVDKEGGNGNHPYDIPVVRQTANLRYRGNSSMYFDKKGYLIKFINEDESDKNVSVLGMERNNEWALHGPFLDKTLLRNYLWYHVASKIMDTAPDSKFCELFVNGEYQGLYLMVEPPTRGEKSRMPISKYKEGREHTSWIVRLDKGEEDKSLNLNTFTAYSYNALMHLEMIYPGKTKRTEQVRQYVIDDISAFEKALYSYDYTNEYYGYADYINVDSFVDYLILNEFTLNYDAGNMSTYLYKDVKGKINMYVWDFNSANNYYDKEMKIDDFQFQWNTWFYMLMKDEKFVQRVVDRYRYLRTNKLKEEYLLKYIDDIIDFLGPAIERNYVVWGYSFEEEADFLEPKERNVRSYDEAIEQLKQNIIDRGRFLDKNIETLKQFSHKSKVKKFTH